MRRWRKVMVPNLVPFWPYGMFPAETEQTEYQLYRWKRGGYEWTTVSEDEYYRY
jgi:hypothetical protein